MKEPGHDGRHRDQATPKKGEIQQKRGETLNKNLPKPIPQFRADTKLETMRAATGAFWGSHPEYQDSEGPTFAWYRDVLRADWSKPSDMQAQFGNASILRMVGRSSILVETCIG